MEARALNTPEAAAVERVHEFNLQFNESWSRQPRYSPSKLNYEIHDGHTFSLNFWFKNDPRKKQQSKLFVRNFRRKKIKIIRSLPLFAFWFYFQLFRRLLLVLHWRAILFWQKYWWVERLKRQCLSKERQNVMKMLKYFLLAANYNPDEDEYLTKHSKGFNELHFDAHDRPICEQPGRPEKIIR